MIQLTGRVYAEWDEMTITGQNTERKSLGPLLTCAWSRAAPPIIAVAVTAIMATWVGTWMIRGALSRDAHRSTRMRFSSVSMALRNYSNIRGHLPDPEVWRESVQLPGDNVSPVPLVRPLYSWRVEIVWYLESWHGTWHPARPWDDPVNKQLVELSFFYAYGVTGTEPYPKSFPETNALAITGPGTAFGDGKEPPKAVKDVPPQTILVVETRQSGIPWPAPGDFDIRTMPQTINSPDGKGISSRYADGFHVIFADEWVWLISNKVPFETLKKFFTIAEARKHDREKLLGPYALHRGP